ncbi:MAG TPA: dihydrofolate reductase family protein [Burkholderiales bacterium]|nr:dihydrofolate reductase family protein [Burkholderiales bacterium]
MSRPRSFPTLAPLETLHETKRGRLLPLPPRLSRLYGRLRMPPAHSRPHVFTNFAATLDGVVSLNVEGHKSGGDISGWSAQDRMVMGLLRALVDAVVIGSGTFVVDRRHLWTAEDIFPKFANDYRALRAALGKRGPPLNAVVSGSGRLDLRLPLFASGKVPALIVTSPAGEKNLRRQRVPDTVRIQAVTSKGNTISARSVLDAVCRASSGKLILVEGGPRLIADFYAEGLLDEQFLTLSPQIAGRPIPDERISLVMGQTFAPRHPLWGSLADLRRGNSHLFLRYAFPRRK